MQLSAISKRFDDGHYALRDVNLTIHRGEILGVAGANGSGKSTLLGILAGQVHPTAGSLTVDPEDTVRVGSVLFRQTVGLASQDQALDPELSATETLILFARLCGIEARERKARIEELTRQWGIDAFADRRISRLSGGQRQRVHLALLFLHDPPIMLFDEPAQGLDRDVRDYLAQEFRRLRDDKRSLVVATHDLKGDGMRFDRIAFLSKGNLVTVGTPEELKAEHTSLDAAYEALAGEPLVSADGSNRRRSKRRRDRV